MDILNKNYKRRNAPDSDVFYAKELNGDSVIFSNGAICKLTTLVSEFEETTVIQSPVTLVSESADINPDTFFNTPSTDNTLLDQVEKLVKNPNAQIEGSQKLNQSVNLDDSRYEVVNPGGKQIQNNNGLASRLNSENSIVQNSTDSENVKQTVKRLPEYDVFDNVKLTQEIEIIVPFKIKLPKADRIDILNDMFKTTFTDYLAKKYISDNIVNNSKKLQDLIKQGIETWMEEQITGKKSKKTKKSKTIDIIEEKDIFIQKSESLIAVDKPDDSTADFFAKAQGPKWDGDIKKLYIINTEEQYNAVKQRFVSLKDTNANHPDIDRFEGMLETYEQQIEQLKQ